MRDKVGILHNFAIVRKRGRLSTSADPTPVSEAFVSSFADKMTTFNERLREAARHAKVEWGQTAIAKSLEVSKQTVDRWMGTGEPKPAQLFRIADRWKIDARWLATGEGQMIAAYPGHTELPWQEQELLRGYREAEPKWQFCLLLLARLAHDEQVQAASDVNVIMARIFGERYKVTPSARVKLAYGDAPHVAQRKFKKEAR